MLNNSGILCHILGIRTMEDLIHSRHKGDVTNNFVFADLSKHTSYSFTRPSIYHYRTSDRKEIDFIVEKGDQLIAVEVKANQTVKHSDFKHIKDLQEKHKKNVLGLVLYNGSRILPFNNNLYAISSLSVFF